MVDDEDKLPCTDIMEEISGTACYLNADFWGLEDLYPEKKLHLSVSDYIESILSCFASICSHLFQSTFMDQAEWEDVASWYSSPMEEFLETIFFFRCLTKGEVTNDDLYEKEMEERKYKMPPEAKITKNKMSSNDDLYEKAPEAQITKRKMPQCKTPWEMEERKYKLPREAKMTKNKMSKHYGEQILGLRQRKR
jgi:hypothetical protein